MAIINLLIRTPIFLDKFSTFSGLTKIIISDYDNVLILVISIMLKIVTKYNLYNRKVSIILITLLELCSILCVAYFVFDMYMAFKSFNTYWGNNRALIWEKSLFIYKNYYNLKQQIFGVGPEFLDEWYYYLSLELDARVLVTHSKSLQILLTMGVDGLINYDVIIISIFRYGFNKRIFSNKNILYFMSLMAYFGQYFVNGVSIFNTGILFMILGLGLKTSQTKIDKTKNRTIFEKVFKTNQFKKIVSLIMVRFVLKIDINILEW